MLSGLGDRTRPQNAPQFAQGEARIAEKPHAEAGSSQVEALAKSRTCIPGAGPADATSASVTGFLVAADFAFHFSAATSRY